jgi:hypothetical protein
MSGVLTKRTVAVFVLAAAIVSVGAGCGGGGSKPNGSAPNLNAGLSSYEKAMLKLGGGLNATLTSVGLANRNAKGPAPIERNLRKSQIELRAAATQLAKIVPPAPIKTEQAQLVRGVREYADELDGVIAKLKSGAGPRALAAIPGLQGLKDMAIATTAITKAGYVITISSS